MAGSLDEVGAQPGGDAVRRFLDTAHNDDGTLKPIIAGATTNLTQGTVQPTTAISPATIVNGVGTAVLQDDTYDGYTVPQVVAALRAAGILA